MNKETKKNHPILDSALKNLFRHDVKHHGNRFNLFCDNFSQFGVAFPSLSSIGLGAVCPRATLSTYEISHPTLQLSFIENNTAVGVQRQELECLPWITIEKTTLPTDSTSIDIVAKHIFQTEKRLVSQFTFTNQGAEPAQFAPVWTGRIAKETDQYMLPYFLGTSRNARKAYIQSRENGLVGGLVVSNPGDDMPETAIRLQCLDKNITANISNLAYTFGQVNDVVLPAGESFTVQFLIEVSIKNSDKKDFDFTSFSGTEKVDFEKTEDDARTRFAGNINIDKLPAVKSPALAAKAWRARAALLRDGYRGFDGEFGDQLACLCTSDNTDFSCTFFWDTLFSSVAISDFHKEYTKGAIRTAFVRMNKRDGSSPERKFNYTPKGRMSQQSPQSPVASWAVLQYLEHGHDENFLKEIYPTLVRNHEFWEKYSDTDRDGLAEYRWSGQVGDNSPLWDEYAALDPTTGCGYVPPVASVALNSFLFWDANNLAQLADLQGLTQDAARFRERAQQLQRDLFAICYLPEEKRFWDYNHHTGLHRRVKTFYMFWPLFAGMDVPAETAKDLIENVLLDPSQFFGENPFPSVAYDEPEYNAKGYWRGRSWPHISYWLLQTLVRYGYVNEAKEAASRILDAYCHAAGYPENLATQPEDFDAAGFADYNWGCAATYLIACGKYLE